MTTLIKEHLDDLVKNTFTMDLQQLIAYGTTVSIANVDPESGRIINEAIDARRLYLADEDVTGLVINGEISAEETRDD
jgi:hypothetical protein